MLLAAASEGMSTLLTEIGAFFTQAITWMSSILTEVTSDPALLILVIAMPVVGFAFGLLGRLIRM